MLSKEELITRLEYIDSAVNDPALLDLAPSEKNHNGKAMLLRKGLGIVAFNALEDYIKNRSQESLNELTSTGISFTNLPKALQEFSIAGSLQALSTTVLKHERRNNENWIQRMQELTQPISSPLSGGEYKISGYSFMHGNSNISDNDISSFLSAYGISNGWRAMQNVSGKLGSGTIDLCQDFKNISTRRNSSAHEAEFNYQHSWLIDVKTKIISIAAAFDILLNNRLLIAKKDILVKMETIDVTNEIKLKFAIHQNGVYKVKNKIGGSSQKNYNSLSELLDSEIPKAITKHETLVVHDISQHSSKVIFSNWYR